MTTVRCAYCDRELSSQGLPGHIRAMHSRGSDMRAVNRRPIAALYLDDERTPKTARDWTIVRSVGEAIDFLLEHGCPLYISFDHDIGDQMPNGLDLAKWLVDRDLDLGGAFIPADFEFNVHSANPTGRDNIVGLLRPYLAQR